MLAAKSFEALGWRLKDSPTCSSPTTPRGESDVYAIAAWADFV